jgi:hypothetical protein
VTKAKYLGVKMRTRTQATTKEIFQDAVDNFFARLRQLRAVVRASTLHQRVHIYNVSLLLILLYLAHFYIIPYNEMIRPTINHCRRAIASFNGGAFAYCPLINTPRRFFGPFTPLRDLWATNMALLAARSPIIQASDDHNLPQMAMGAFGHVTPASCCCSCFAT